jgi:hypothetical protein
MPRLDRGIQKASRPVGRLDARVRHGHDMGGHQQAFDTGAHLTGLAASTAVIPAQAGMTARSGHGPAGI